MMLLRSKICPDGCRRHGLCAVVSLVDGLIPEPEIQTSTGEGLTAISSGVQVQVQAWAGGKQSGDWNAID
jgi:hypothetical protein